MACWHADKTRDANIGVSCPSKWSASDSPHLVTQSHIVAIHLIPGSASSCLVRIEEGLNAMVCALGDFVGIGRMPICPKNLHLTFVDLEDTFYCICVWDAGSKCCCKKTLRQRSMDPRSSKSRSFLLCSIYWTLKSPFNRKYLMLAFRKTYIGPYFPNQMILCEFAR